MSGDPNQTSQTTVTPAELPTPQRSGRLLLRRVAWWFKLVAQPLIAVAAIVLLFVALGALQRMSASLGWTESAQQSGGSTGSVESDVEYMCPMLCVPPSKEPGRCPVCGMELQPIKKSTGGGDNAGISVEPAKRKVANITTSTAVRIPVSRQIRAIGKIGYDKGTLATISAYVDGRLDEMYVDYEGVKVEKGQPLGLLYSPQLYSAQVGLLEARRLLKKSTSDNSRLADSNQRLYASARERLKQLGLTEEQIDEVQQRGTAESRVKLVAPDSGTVTTRRAVKGQYVKAGDVILELADLSTVWLILELFPEDAAAVRYGQKVVTQIQSLPGSELSGRVAFIDPVVNPTTQAIQVRVHIPNELGLIKVGDFARANLQVPVQFVGGDDWVYDPELAGKWISPRHPHIISDQPGLCPKCGEQLVPASQYGYSDTPTPGSEAVVVPRSAVLIAGPNSIVYVETEPGHFVGRRVEVGAIMTDQVAVVSGLEPGEKVAQSGTLLLDSQANMMGKPSLIDPNSRLPEMFVDPEEALAIAEAFAQLPAEDRAVAEQQRICPVSELKLGAMGPLVKAMVNDRAVFLCCEGCRKRLYEDPDKYLAVIDNYAASPPPGPDDLGGAADVQQADEIAAALAALSSEDRALAEKQIICPVTDLPLGSMGTPIRIEVEGRTVFICCEGCVQALRDQPAKYLAKLPAGDQR